jgi:hypothetical protein
MPLTDGNLPWLGKDCCLLLDGLEKNYRGCGREVVQPFNAPKVAKTLNKQTDRGLLGSPRLQRAKK